ncbi:DUF2306 domain-containing protein [Ideonella sp.]|uniref:DUF2306 domain-containing protein n=1 Tax=Ideonella sp. TaxID=1929293 RepID=UPI0035AF6B2D
MPSSFSPAALAGVAGRQATAVVADGLGPLGRVAGRALPWAATAWCAVAVIGQLIFTAYVLRFYGAAAVAGEPQRWNKVLPHGWVPGDTPANVLTSLHLLFTVLIIASAIVQLLPVVRRRAPVLHRWNGRFYVVSALLMAGSGLWMVATRKTVGDWPQHLAVSLNGVLIIAFALMAWRLAAARRFEQHRRWALRLFLAVSGVWFFRIGLMAWIVLNQGPAGFDPQTFTGPFLSVLGFAQYLLPLAVLEAYLRTREKAGPRTHLAMAAGLGALTLLTALGIGAATMIMWLPRM